MQFKMKRGNRNKKNQKRKGAEPGCCPSCQAITDVYRHLQTSHCQSAVHEAIWGSPQYPCPSHVNTSSFLSIKLDSHLDYVAWKEQMLCLLDSQGMRGFIDGTFKKPQANGGPKGKPEKTKYKEWSRSDALVKGWIFGSISEYNMDDVIGLETAHEVWNKLKNIFTTPPAPISSTDAEIQTQTDKEKCEEEYVPLCRAIGMGDWKKAQEFFNEDKDALINKLNHFGQRTLHLAIGNPENVKFLDNLLDLINPESLPTLVDNDGHNPLHLAATLDHREAAEKLVGKNPHLLFILDKHNCLPIQKAIYNSHKATFLYLLQVCKQYIGLSQQEGYHSPFMGQYGLMLLNETIWSGFFDVAYALLTEYPELATTIAPPYNSLLWSIGKEKDAFRSAKCYNFYQRFLYSHVSTKSYGIEDTHKIPDIENQETNSASVVTKCTKSYSVIKMIYVKFWEVALLHVPHIMHLHEDKVKHNLAIMILRFICEEVVKLQSNHFGYYSSAYIAAILNDTPEVIEALTEFFPRSVWTTNSDGYVLSQLSIKNRCEHVYNYFVHEVTHEKYLHNSIVDKDGNNLLHLAGQLAPAYKLNMVTGAALQMQRELQWFQEVRKLMRSKDREAKIKKGETPMMVFKNEHEDLRKKGEEWIKKTADSYTITAALIITIVFAAAITVPGGNNGDTGKAIFERRSSFIIFAISDAISLFTSTTSLLLFLSILTTRYAEEDFLHKLPKRLILGLVMLFMSVTTMLIAFSTTLYIMFGQENSWILIPIAAITCLPIASFVTLQLPLLIDLISSTYGPGIFVKRSELRITS
ncbi:uncharacterized protein LOC110900846 isoform X2 [Helianthus annuus]|uniref:uncharacterized protein LOC110900846 isoform X2 n=1 Tax=Helianthus annuus TaxID=4232 RepID=UPI001652FD70|nr:uncharacterized protein LOC110900846 isoform X2 [Helianthus annuus]